MELKEIVISKASEHNLKSLNLSLPKNKLIVITGPSGSGKSSLAFDTIYAEGQRRYIESLSSYARQFLGQLPPAQVESISGLSPSIAIDQKSTNKNPRSTVGTVTEIYDYMRVLFARIGEKHCPECHDHLMPMSKEKMVQSLMALPLNSKLILLAPLVKNKKGQHKEILAQMISQGLSRFRLNGEIFLLEDLPEMKKTKSYSLEVVIDRIALKENSYQRLSDSIETALRISKGELIVLTGDKASDVLFFSEESNCKRCNISFPELAPNSFSFNSPLGACPHCNGLGTKLSFDPETMIESTELSLDEGAIIPLKRKNSFIYHMFKCVAKVEKINLHLPYKDLPEKIKKLIFYGSSDIYTYSFRTETSRFNFKKKFPGLIKWLDKRYHESESEKVRSEIENYLKLNDCSACQGERLNAFSLAVTLPNSPYNISSLVKMPAQELLATLKKLSFEKEAKIISEKLLSEILQRLFFLNNVGLHYLSLARPAGTLSGGENQRIRLATQIGSKLTGVIYVLDEPSIGLHQRDNAKLIETLKSLRDLGNTVIVVEHDEETMLAADYLVDMGPKAGVEGGYITAAGTLKEVLSSKTSLTAKFLNKEITIPFNDKKRTSPHFLTFKGGGLYNLKEISLHLPLQTFVCLTGVSGSGKSTLLHQLLLPAIEEKSSRKHQLKVDLPIDSIIRLNQDPIGRTPKSNPGTYCGVFDDIRALYATLPDSKARGYKPGRFSFNVKGGRCDECEGAGVKKVEMHFLSDLYITCESCKGQRYNQETLLVRFKGKNIADVLDLTISEVHTHFSAFPKIERTLATLCDVGLGYMKLGQSATTLSGGEAQRLKLARELSKKPKGHCLYVLDEPTTGLHAVDIKHLLDSLHRLVDLGHSMIVIEHNLDVIKTADYIIDLGPEGGPLGGEIVCVGTVEEIIKEKKSHTGVYLKKALSSLSQKDLVGNL